MTQSSLLADMMAMKTRCTVNVLDQMYQTKWREPMSHLEELGIISQYRQNGQTHFYVLPMVKRRCL
jgi:hypothetical protein